MKYRQLGKTGFSVSEIGFGAWAIGAHWGEQSEKDSLEALGAAVDAGVNFVDTAAAYGDGKSEQIIGKIMKERSERIYVSTKTPPLDGPYPPSPYCDAEVRYPEEYLRTNVEERCRMLGVEAVDILLLHSWTRAWNDNPYPLEVLRRLKQEGKILYAGISTPEHDQNCAVDLIRDGWVDVVEVVFNIFEQEPAAQLLPAAAKDKVGIINRVVFDEGSLTGKFTEKTEFGEGDFRREYFSGDRLSRTVKRVEALKKDLIGYEMSLPQVAIKFSLQQEGISTVIPGMRNAWQAKANTAVSDLPDMPEDVIEKLHAHMWRKAFWYFG